MSKTAIIKSKSASVNQNIPKTVVEFNLCNKKSFTKNKFLIFCCVIFRIGITLQPAAIRLAYKLI